MSQRREYGFIDHNGVGSQPQKSEDSEKLPLQQPVRLQPSWEESNLPEEELNFRNLTMDDASLQLHTPADKYNLVYMTFLLHGIGVLMPWNMFITADSYFTNYKLGKGNVGTDPVYADNFIQFVGFASQVPNVIFNWLNIFIQIGGNLTTRIIWSISIEVLIFILTVALAMTDSREWPGTFFWITIISVVILNMANGIYQNTIFGMAAKLPLKYTGAVVLGSNISGTFTAIARILSDTFASSQRMSAIYYFITSLFVLLLCFDTYFALPLNRFYRHYELKEKKEALIRKNQNMGMKERTPYFYIFKKALPQLVNIFFVFFVTLSIFPAIQAKVKAVDPSFFLTETYFTSVTCFLTFNMSAMIGSYLTAFCNWPKPKYLWIPVVLRLFYIPFFLLSNYHISTDITVRALPVVIKNDWVYWITASTMGLTSGYLSSLGMMYAPRTVEPRYASTAGMFAAAALITELTGHQTNDVNIIDNILKEAQNENSSNVIALIIKDTERMKRKVESVTPVAAVATPELPYAEPSGDPVLYSAALPTNNDVEAMIYSSRPPLLKTNTSSINLGVATIAKLDVRDTYTRLIATILVESGKIYLRFKFPWLNGYWYLSSVEVEFVGEHAKQFNLTLNQDVTAPRRFSYHCGGQIVFNDAENDIELYLFEVQAQPDAYRHRFGDAYNCVAFTTGPLWSGLFVTFVLVIGLAVGLTALGSIKTMDKFDNHKTKQLSITVWE